MLSCLLKCCDFLACGALKGRQGKRGKWGMDKVSSKKRERLLLQGTGDV